MSLSTDDLGAIKQIVNEAIQASEERMSGKIDTSIQASEERMKNHTSKEVAKLEKRTGEKFEQLTLQIGRGFNEVHEKLSVLDDKIENVKQIVSAEVKRVDQHESTIGKIRKQLRAV